MSDLNTINSDLIRGHIDTIILKSLFESDRYGYDIIKEIEQKTGGNYKIKQPTLYSCLRRLEEQGFTRSYWGAKAVGGRKKYYTLTDMGKELFIKNRSDWEHSRAIIDRLVSDGVSPAFNAFVTSTDTHLSDRKISDVSSFESSSTEGSDEYYSSAVSNSSVADETEIESDIVASDFAERSVVANDQEDSFMPSYDDVERYDNFSDNGSEAAAIRSFYSVERYSNFDDDVEFSSPVVYSDKTVDAIANDLATESTQHGSHDENGYRDIDNTERNAYTDTDTDADYGYAVERFDNFGETENIENLDFQTEYQNESFATDENSDDRNDEYMGTIGEIEGIESLIEDADRDSQDAFADDIDINDIESDVNDNTHYELDDDSQAAQSFSDNNYSNDDYSDIENGEENVVIQHFSSDDSSSDIVHDSNDSDSNELRAETNDEVNDDSIELDAEGLNKEDVVGDLITSDSNELQEETKNDDCDDSVELDADSAAFDMGESENGGRQVGIQTSIFDSSFTVSQSPNSEYAEHRPIRDVNTFELANDGVVEKDDYYSDVYSSENDTNEDSPASTNSETDVLSDSVEYSDIEDDEIKHAGFLDGINNSRDEYLEDSDPSYNARSDNEIFDEDFEKDGELLDEVMDTDNSSPFDDFEFTGSTYELAPGTDALQETVVTRSGHTQTDSESYYFDIKDKPSYVDEMSKSEYEPSKSTYKEFADTYVYEDDEQELPYEEHVKQEYADDAVELGGVDEIAEVEIASGGGGGGGSVLGDSADGGLNRGAGGARSGYDVNELEGDTDSEHDGKDKEFAQFLKYDSKIESADGKLSDDDILARDYQSTLARLIREQVPSYSEDPVQQSKLEKTAASARQMGEDVIIRKHTESIKEYHSENYYFSNRLRLTHYMAMFLIMLVETAFSFLIFEVGVHNGVITSGDRWIYIIGVLVSFALPGWAFVRGLTDYGRRKRIDLEFKSSFYFRLVVCILIMLITFIVNMYFGILHGNFSDYLTSLFYPMILSTNTISSLFVYKICLDSKKYHCQ